MQQGLELHLDQEDVLDLLKGLELLYLDQEDVQDLLKDLELDLQYLVLPLQVLLLLHLDQEGEELAQD